MSNFCSRCGAKLDAMRCHDCGYEHYVNPRPTASLLILNDRDELLLLKRARDPKKGMWETPGGFCDTWEEPADAAVREGREELGVDVHLGPFAGMWIGGYEFQGELLSVLDCFWWAKLPSGAEVKVDPSETVEYQWFPLTGLPELAFSTMTRAVQCQKPDRFE